jgi:hypothetical protein
VAAGTADRRKAMPGKSPCGERTGFLSRGQRYAAGVPGSIRSADKPGLSVACVIAGSISRRGNCSGWNYQKLPVIGILCTNYWNILLK